jgi:hypothetical protein
MKTTKEKQTKTSEKKGKKIKQKIKKQDMI